VIANGLALLDGNEDLLSPCNIVTLKYLKCEALEEAGGVSSLSDHAATGLFRPWPSGTISD
jgi:hypothetical protein